MLSIKTALEDNKTHVGAVAGAISIVRYFNVLSTSYYVYDASFCLKIPKSIFVINLSTVILNGIYASLILDVLLATVNVIYAAIDSACILTYWYYYYSPANLRLNRRIECFLENVLISFIEALVVVLIFYGLCEMVKLEREEKRFRCGLGLNIFNMITLIKPARKLEYDIKQHFILRIDPENVLQVTLIYVLWLIYAIAIEDEWMFLLNLQFLTICLTQMIAEKYVSIDLIRVLSSYSVDDDD
nr:uncharacterized protein LOC111428611 [Onthophagus taurus]